MPRPARGCALLLLTAMLAGCSSTGPSDTIQLEAARARWSGSGIASHYQVELSRLCFCGFPGAFSRTALVVTNGQIVQAWDVGTGDAVPAGLWGQFPTVIQLFDLIAAEIAAGSDLIQVSYHPDHGAPMTIFLDRIRQAIDDELSITIHLLDDGALDAPPHLAR